MRGLLVALLVLVALASACEKWEKQVGMFCHFGGESKPCLQAGADAEKKSCCSSGGCPFTQFKKDKVCCLTNDCLARCYPGKNYKIGQVY